MKYSTGTQFLSREVEKMKRAVISRDGPLAMVLLFISCMLICGVGVNAQMMRYQFPLSSNTGQNGGNDRSELTVMWIALLGGVTGWAVSNAGGSSISRADYLLPSGTDSGNLTDPTNIGSNDPGSNGDPSFGSNGSSGGYTTLTDPPANDPPPGSDPPPGGDPVPEPSGLLTLGLGLAVIVVTIGSRQFKRFRVTH